MVFSRQLVLCIAIGAILVTLGFVAWSYSVDNSHMTRFDHYFRMVLYFLFTMAVMTCATVAFQVAIGGWWPQSKVGRYSNVVAKWALSALVLWLAFWHQSLFLLWIVFVLALVVLLGFFSGIIPWRFSQRTQ
jgi:hypothetical protein